MFKNPLNTKENKREVRKLRHHVRNDALKKARRIGFKDEEGRLTTDEHFRGD